MRPYSLARRLVLSVLLLEFAAALVLTVAAGIYEGFSHFGAFDVMLRGRADSMLGAVQDAEDTQDNVMLDGTQTLFPQRDIFVVSDERGVVLGRSPNWPEAERFVVSRDTRQFRTLLLHGESYRVLQVTGLRMVDPGDAGGGIPRRVTIFYGARTHPVWERIWRAVAFYAVASAMVLLATGIVMLWVMRRGLEPLQQLATEAGRISTQSWSFMPSAHARAVRELAPLILALEIALAGLERSFAQQSQFVSDAAHELKTSVAVLKSSLQVLTMRSRTAPEYATGLERLESDCQRMEDLVTKMLMLARLEAAPAEKGSAGRVDLSRVVREIAQQFHSVAEVAGVVIRIEASPLPVWVEAERDELRLLCSNLIHNALQHSARGSEIRVLLLSRSGGSELRIEDDGEGIAPEVLPFVFDRFFRGDSSRSRRTGGTGLGLAISRAIALHAGGRIELESTPGRGTSAKVYLPLFAGAPGVKSLSRGSLTSSASPSASLKLPL